jgi:hypothetical protein
MDAEDRSNLYGTVFGWTAGLLRLLPGSGGTLQANRYPQTAFDPERPSIGLVGRAEAEGAGDLPHVMT